MDEEEKKIRHTISAEETFTLAKDVYDIRTFIKSVYANRAVIARRINIFTLCFGLVFTAFYAVLVIITSLGNKLSLGNEIVLYSLIGVFALLALLVIVFAVLSSRVEARHIKKFNLFLKILRLALRIVSIAVSISAIVFAPGAATHIAVQVILIVFSVVTLIVQLIPLLFGGVAKLVRWLLSPAGAKTRFSAVALEWYELAVTNPKDKKSAKKVEKKHHDAVSELLDGTLLPILGKKYITAIKPAMLLEIDANAPEEVRPVLQGLMKSIFAYAAECGYITFDPCRDLPFEGTIEKKPRKTLKQRLFGVGLKLGKSALDKYIAGTDSQDK